MNIRRQLGTVLLLMVLVGGAQTNVLAQGLETHHNSARDRIVGVWDVQVAVFDCTTRTQLASFPALHKYELGGTAQVVPAASPAALPEHVGIWHPVRKNRYQLTFKAFRFDTDGNYVGWTVVKNDIAINENATGYAGSGQAEVFDADGNKVGMSCPAFTGTRFSQ
jgi:hypothetical protein